MAFGSEALSPVPGAVEVTRHFHLLHPAVCECFGGGLPADWAPQASSPGGLLVGSAGWRPEWGRQGWPWFLSALSSFPLWVVSPTAPHWSFLHAPSSWDETPALCLQVGDLVSCLCDPAPGKVWALCFSSSLGPLTFFLLSQCLCTPFTMLNLCVADLV